LPSRLLDAQGEYVRPGIMSDRIEVELRAGDLVEVDLGRQDALAFVVRPGEDLAERAHHAASSW